MVEATLFDFWRSSAAYRVRIALNLVDIAYRTVPVDLDIGTQKRPEHLARNPQGLVPVLDIDGHRFTQSLAIIDYLNETRGLSFVPGDAPNRAKIRAVAMAVAVDIHPICNLSVATRASRDASDPEAARLQWMRDFIGPGLAAFDTLLDSFQGVSYCCADTPTLAEYLPYPTII